MKTFKYFVIAIMAVCLASCGGKEEAGDYVTLEIQETNMGSFSNYGSFSGKVKLKLNATEEKTEEGMEYIVSIPLTITSDVAWKYNLTFLLTVADEDHSTIKELGYLYIHGEYDSDSHYNYLVSGDVRQDFEVRLTDKEWKAIQEGGKYLIIMCKTGSDEICSRGGSKTSSSSDTSDNDDDDSYSSSDDNDDKADSYSSSSSSGSQDWDALLNSYEQYVDKYISYMKKAAKGDMSALSDYPALMEKAQEFSSKMEGAKGDMSASQWARYIKITNKMTQAAANMH